MKRRSESFGSMIDRTLRRTRKMPYRTLAERKARADAVGDAIAAWKRDRASG